MNRIVHISLKVDDVNRTGDFYRNVFGFVDAETKRTRDHVSRHMCDGVIYFTLMKYDRAPARRNRRPPGTVRASTTSLSRCPTSPKLRRRFTRADARS